MTAIVRGLISASMSSTFACTFDILLGILLAGLDPDLAQLGCSLKAMSNCLSRLPKRVETP